jgi:hypothetical protein
MFFISALIMISVGVTTAKIALSWTFVTISAIWILLTIGWSYRSDLLEGVQDNSRYAVPPAMNATFSIILTLPSITLFSISVNHWE